MPDSFMPLSAPLLQEYRRFTFISSRERTNFFIRIGKITCRRAAYSKVERVALAASMDMQQKSKANMQG
jgi:hypothetical protein